MVKLVSRNIANLQGVVCKVCFKNVKLIFCPSQRLPMNDLTSKEKIYPDSILNLSKALSLEY